MAKKKILVTETALRDAHQSLIATRMPIEDMLPILDKMDKIGYHSIECWGGATFDACLRFLNEDPWERLRILRKNLPNTKLQMLFRGQNMLGYRHYADDVLEYFVQRTVANGIDIIRIFDALNDIKNLQVAIKAAKKEGAHAQVAISYTTGPVFTHEYYVEYAKRIADAGADSICIKDMAALLTPSETYSLVKEIKKAVDLPIQLHTHYTSGLASMCLLKGIEAGVDIIDTAISPLALGTSHAPTESMVAALANTDYDTGLDLVALSEVREYFMTLRKKYIDSVCNAGSYSTSAVVQHTFALLLEMTNRVAEYNAFTHKNGWCESETFSPFIYDIMELSGKTMGIVGYGSIGKAVANAARAFGMNVIVNTRTVREDGITKFVSFDELLEKSDIISLHCPLNKQSEKLFNAETFAKMKQGAYFINTARGGIVDEVALADSLKSGHLGGAAVDTIAVEPMRNDCPLKDAPNLLITPHVAWAPKETRERLVGIVYNNLKNFIDGKPTNVVTA